MPRRSTRADLVEATCGGNGTEGALTFHGHGLKMSYVQTLTHKPVDMSDTVLSLSHMFIRADSSYTLAYVLLFSTNIHYIIQLVHRETYRSFTSHIILTCPTVVSSLEGLNQQSSIAIIRLSHS